MKRIALTSLLVLSLIAVTQQSASAGEFGIKLSLFWNRDTVAVPIQVWQAAQGCAYPSYAPSVAYGHYDAAPAQAAPAFPPPPKPADGGLKPTGYEQVGYFYYPNTGYGYAQAPAYWQPPSYWYGR
jgi:hypothetical protein